MRALRLLSCGSWDFASPEDSSFLVLVAPYLFPVVGSKTWLTLLALDTKALQSLLDPFPHVLSHWQVLYVNKSSPVDSSQCKARSRKAGIGRPSFICSKKTRQSVEQLFASAGPSCKQNDGLALFET